MKRLILFTAFFFSMLVCAATDPNELKLKVYAVYMSTSPYCTSLVPIFTSTNPEFMDFLINPTLGTLDNSKSTFDGSYPCLIFKMSERVYFRPKVMAGGCVQDSQYTTDLCPDGTTVTSIDGSTSMCGAGEDTVYLYLTTVSTGTTLASGVNPFSPPTSTNVANGLRLGNAFSIFGTRSGRFVVNAADAVNSSGPTNCSLSFPLFSFANE